MVTVGTDTPPGRWWLRSGRRSASGSSPGRVQRALDEEGDELLDREVALLDVGRHGRGHPDRDVGERRERTAGRARERDHPQSTVPERVSAARTTFAEFPLVEIAISTSPAAAERLHLPGEDAFDAEVVRDRGEQRRSRS